MEYKEQLKQADREARAAVVGLVLTIVVWALAGFGVAASGIVVGSTPLWIITGLGGAFVFAVCVSVFLAKRVFKDVRIEDVEPVAAQPQTAENEGAGE